MNTELVSILMLTHNAPSYVETTIRTLHKNTKNVRYELIVLDNASRRETRDLVFKLFIEGLIGKLLLLDHNSLFSKGNNLASKLSASEATHFLLLNSDVEIRSPEWLSHLLSIHERGITTYGWVRSNPDKVDGYCLLVDSDLFRKHGLDERHQWWFAITKLQAILLNEGLSVKGYEHHEAFIHHFGGKSGDSFKGAAGMDVSDEEVHRWFNGVFPTKIDAT